MAKSLVKILIRLIYLTKPRTPWLLDCYVPIGMGLVAFSLLAATTLGPPCVAQGFADNDANLKTLPQGFVEEPWCSRFGEINQTN